MLVKALVQNVSKEGIIRLEPSEWFLHVVNAPKVVETHRCCGLTSVY